MPKKIKTIHCPPTATAQCRIFLAVLSNKKATAAQKRNASEGILEVTRYCDDVIYNHRHLPNAKGLKR